MGRIVGDSNKTKQPQSLKPVKADATRAQAPQPVTSRQITTAATLSPPHSPGTPSRDVATKTAAPSRAYSFPRLTLTSNDHWVPQSRLHVRPHMSLPLCGSLASLVVVAGVFLPTRTFQTRSVSPRELRAVKTQYALSREPRSVPSRRAPPAAASSRLRPRRGGAVHAPATPGSLPPPHRLRRPPAESVGGRDRQPRARAYQAPRRGGLGPGGAGGPALLAEDLVPRAAASDGRRVVRARYPAVPRPRPPRGRAGAVLRCRPGYRR